MKSAKNGFTLIELLVVVLIIGILAAIALPQYQKAVEKSRATEAFMNLKALREAWDRYKLTYGTTATTIEQLTDFDVKIDISNPNNHYSYILDPNGAIHAIEKPNARYKLIAITSDFPDLSFKPGTGIVCDEKTTENRGTCKSFGAREKGGATIYDRYMLN
jgi:type II secretion system protein G